MEFKPPFQIVKIRRWKFILNVGFGVLFDFYEESKDTYNGYKTTILLPFLCIEYGTIFFHLGDSRAPVTNS